MIFYAIYYIIVAISYLLINQALIPDFQLSPSLHNVDKESRVPLLVYLPPYSTASACKPAKLPRFAQGWPTAVINYRWPGFGPFDQQQAAALVSSEGSRGEAYGKSQWPTPIHDVIKAHDWIIHNPRHFHDAGRDIYVVGSYLGASLGMALALTETHPRREMGIRGCVAYNGIYNWTKFLYRHPDYDDYKSPTLLEAVLSRDIPKFQELRRQAKELFRTTDSLFDPYASPGLFFHSPGLRPPEFFDDGKDGSKEVNEPSGAVKFPPRSSTLAIPQTLLLHSNPPPLPSSVKRELERHGQGNHRNTFKSQAFELAKSMRSSVVKYDLKERYGLNHEVRELEAEAKEWVQTYDVTDSSRGYDLSDEAEELAAEWLEDLIPR